MFVWLLFALGFGESAESIPVGPGDAACVIAFAEPTESIPAGSSGAAGALVLAELIGFFASQEEEADICLSRPTGPTGTVCLKAQGSEVERWKWLPQFEATHY